MNWQIHKLNDELRGNIQAQIDKKTKPTGSLGQLEHLAMQLSLIAQTHQTELTAEHCSILIFAADHGIADAGVSIAPSEVTGQMVANFVAGGAAINCFCRVNNIKLKVIDAGVKFPPNIESENLINQWMSAGTLNIAEQPAMTVTQATKALEKGASVAKAQINQGAQIIGFGEMGIANTSSASALLSALLGQTAQQTVGRGTGISDEQFKLKTELVQQALERVLLKHDMRELSQLNNLTMVELLAELGGFEIAQITGAMLQTAELGKPIVVDGFIVSVAALIAYHINPNIADYFIFAHQSNEQAHLSILNYFNAKALLQLDLRLGEGTGAALAFPLIKSAVEFYNHMATFEDANVAAVN